MKIKRSLKLLLSVSLMTLTVAVDNNVIYSTTKDSNNTVIYINSSNLNIVNKAFDSNIKTVANIVENNTKKYQSFLINGKYWARSEERKDSIEILKKIFTYVWERDEEVDYYQNLVEAFVEDISTLLKDDKKSRQYDVKPWVKTKTGKNTLELLIGLVSFRTFYNVKTSTDVKSVDAIFNEVFNEVKKDFYYQRLVEHFNGSGEELKKIIKHSWDCYFNQFCILNNGKFEDKKLKSVVEQLRNEKIISYSTKPQQKNTNEVKQNEELDIVEQEFNYFDKVDEYLQANGVKNPDVKSYHERAQKKKDERNKEDNKKDKFDDLFLKLKNQNITPEQFANDYCLVSALMKNVQEKYSGTKRFIERIKVILDINSASSTPKLSHSYKKMTSEKIEKSERSERLEGWMKLRLASLKLRDKKLSSFIEAGQTDMKTKEKLEKTKYSTMYENMRLSSEEDDSIEKILNQTLDLPEYLNEKDDSKVIEYIKALSKICGDLPVSEICDAFELLKKLSTDSVRDIFDITRYATSLIKGADKKTFPQFILELYKASENDREVSEKILQEMYNLHGKILDETAIKEFRQNSGAKIDEILSKFTPHFKEKYELKKEYRSLLPNFIQKLAYQYGVNKNNFVSDIIKQHDEHKYLRHYLPDCLDQCAKKKMSSEQFNTYLNIVSLAWEMEYPEGSADIFKHTQNVFYMMRSFIEDPSFRGVIRFRISSLLFFVEKRGDIFKKKDFYRVLSNVKNDLVASRLDHAYQKLQDEFIELMKNLTSHVISPLNASFFSDVERIITKACRNKYKDSFTSEELRNYSSLAQYVNTLEKKSKSYTDLLTLVVETVEKNDNNLEKAKEKLKELYSANKNKIEYATDLIKYI